MPEFEEGVGSLYVLRSNIDQYRQKKQNIQRYSEKFIGQIPGIDRGQKGFKDQKGWETLNDCTLTQLLSLSTSYNYSIFVLISLFGQSHNSRAHKGAK